MKLSYHYAASHALGHGRSKDQPARRADIVVLTSLREQVLRRVAESDSHNSGLHERWNHNHHYHRVITGVIGPDCQDALEVGCGVARGWARPYLISGSRGRPRIRSP